MNQINIAIVVSQFNKIITDKLLSGTLNRLKFHNVNIDEIKILKVPGAIEIHYAAQCLLDSQPYDAIICLGSVIRGETNHYDYVCQQVMLWLSTSYARLQNAYHFWSPNY